MHDVGGHRDRTQPHWATEEGREAANEALAAAWSGADFDADDIAGWRDAIHPEAGTGPLSADTIHAVLDARQRGVLADLFEKRGPGMFLGHRGGKGKHGGKHGAKQGDHGKHDPAAFAAKAVAAMGEPISCIDAQRTSITTLLDDAKPSREKVSDADRTFAAAFRADTLDAAQLSGYLDGLRAHHGAKLAARDGVMVQIHTLLTPAQRTTVAAAIEEHGAKALIRYKGEGKGDEQGA